VTRVLKPCGTHAAYCRHIQRGEQPCEPCKAGHAEYRAAAVAKDPDKARRLNRKSAERRRRGVPAHVDPCGTPAAYQRHRRHLEEPCDACQEAWSEYCHQGYLRRKAGAS
jgi:hypothetical protein